MSDTAIALPKFDVFLTFRGLDTRHKFISFLYKELVRRNIRTFKDDKDLGSGRRISQELKRAVEGSKFAVVVVSLNYAGSSWCLNELLNIMQLENKNLITVIPIFYGVEPTQVRRQTGEFGEQFKKHKAREDRETVESWKQALTNLTDISGKCSSESEDDSNLVDKIADRISELMCDTTRSKGSDVDTTRNNGSNLEGINRESISYTKKYISYSCINISISL